MRQQATRVEFSPAGRRGSHRHRRPQGPQADLSSPPPPTNQPDQARVETTTGTTATALPPSEDELRWETTLNRISSILLAVLAIGTAAFWSRFGTRLALSLITVFLVLAGASGLSWLVLERSGFRRALNLIRGVNVTLEASLATLVLAIVTLVKGPQAALTSGVVVLYALALVTATARMRPRLTLYATAVVVIEYVAIHLLVIAPALPEHALGGNWTVLAERALCLALAGGAAGYVTRMTRGRLIVGEVQAAERRWLEREFGRYVSADVVSAILRGEASFGLAERREVTVLFCDLRDFTSFCEREQPEDVVRMLNEFFARVCKIVETHGGTVNKFFGDGVMALFGAPAEHPNHAPAAADAAHEILAAVDELRARGGNWARFDAGIGIDTGDVVVGPVGAPDRVEYTAIGATVNRAARLQSVARAARRRIILSGAALKAIGPRANVVSLGEVSLKGFSTPEAVYAFRHS